MVTATDASADGEMAGAIAAFDWSKTPLGGADTWSPALRMMVRFLLANRFPLLLWWGPEYICLYNDAYRPVLGTKHPWALGRPVREVWQEIWPILKPLIDTPYHGGPATWDDDIVLEINRHGFVEETHFTIAYSAVPDETAPGEIGGILATVNEITGKVIADRRVSVLRELGARSVDAKTAEEACAIAVETLAAHPKDVPFSLLYLIGGDRSSARLAGAAGLAGNEAVAPAAVCLEGDEADGWPWPLAEVIRSEAPLRVTGLADRLGSHLPPSPWADPVHNAVVVPVASSRPHLLAGFLVAGISPRLALDDSYLAFLNLVSGQISLSIANARAHEHERERTEALAEVDRVKTMFLSNVSHEFRTPLTLMLGPLEEALRGSDGPEVSVHRGDLEMAHRNGLRLLKLVNTILDFSRIEAGRLHARYEPVDLGPFTAELASAFRSAIDAAGLSLVLDCRPATLPVHVDPDMWEKVVLNLVSNAFKYTLEGEIRVRLDVEEEQAVLVVSDTGVGIPEDELPRVFERFHRVSGARGRTHEGTGIGLALVQELVGLHGGSVRASSVPGEGSQFVVTIPTGTAHLDGASVVSEEAAPSTRTGPAAFVEEAMRWLPGGPCDSGGDDGAVADRAAPPTGETAPVDAGLRPLVVWADDNEDMRDYVTRLLSPTCEVIAVANGSEALRTVQTVLPDVVLADVMMPGLDGLDLVKAIRSEVTLAEVPIILMSARAAEESRIEGHTAGADDYLVKPFSAQDLVARVRAHARLHRLRREATQELRASMRRQRRVALELQEALLPGALVSHPGIELSARYVAGGEAMQVGGDWYDAFALDDDTIVLTVGDVAGHDLFAAAAMGRLRIALEALAAGSPGPGRLLDRLETFARERDGAKFATACCCFLNPATGVLRYASAGHPPLLLVPPRGDPEWLTEGLSPPLGSAIAGTRTQASVQLTPGSLLVMYSDGLVERRGEVITSGLDRLASVAAGARQLSTEVVCDTILTELVETPHPGDDDTVVVCMRFR